MSTIDSTRPSPRSTTRSVAKKARTILAFLAGLGATAIVAEGKASAAGLLYGHAYAIQNGMGGWQGGYLDARGGGCQGNFLCVSTSAGSGRDGGSGTWVITSADGKLPGTPVMAGDRVRLHNLWNDDGGYLDTRSSGCQGGQLCVSTSTSPSRDGGSGTWKVLPSDPSVTGAISEGMDIHFQNLWNNNGGYLNTSLGVCQGNLFCVDTRSAWETIGASTHWRFQGLTSVFHQAATPFCRDTAHPGTLIDNGLATLTWDPFGRLNVINKYNPSQRTSWGMSGWLPLFGADMATVCFDGHDLTIKDHTQAVVWRSSQTTESTQLVLDRCKLSVDGASGTKWSAAPEGCDRPRLTPGYCVDRPVGASIPILWKDGVELLWQPDGNLVLYANEGDFHGATWASGTVGTGAKVCYQGDGNLVVSNTAGAAVWASNSVGSTYLELDACGAHADRVLSGTRYELWRTHSSFCPSMSIDNHETGGGWCRSKNASATLLDSGAAHLDWQGDGNLVLYSADGAAKASSKTANNGGWLCFQGDGNLVVYDNAFSPLWATGSLGGDQLTLVGCTAKVSNQTTGSGIGTSWSFNPCFTSIPGGGFSFVFDKSAGDSDFGAELWVVAGATNAATLATFKQSLPSGTIEDVVDGMIQGAPSGFAEVLGDAGVSATVFSHNLTVFEVGGYVRTDENDFFVTVLDNTIHHDVSFDLVNQQFSLLDFSRTFMLGGVVPVTVGAGVDGHFTLNLGLNASPNSASATLTPEVGIDGSLSVGLGASGVQAGVEGSLNLATVSAPLTFAISFPQSGPRTWTSSATINETLLDGSLSLFAEAGPLHYSHELVSWDGLSYSQPLFSSANKPF